MKRTLSLLLLLGSSALAAPVVFVKTYVDGAELLQWTEGPGGQLSGTYQLVAITEQGTRLSTQNAAFTGIRQGGAVSVKFTQTVLGTSSTILWTGTLAAQTLTLNRPQSAGIAFVTFTKGSLAAYNSAVARFQVQVQRQHKAAQQAVQERAAQQAKVEAQTRAVRETNADAAAALSTAAQLRHDVQDDLRALSDVSALFRNDLASLETDQRILLKDAETARGSKDCYDVHTIQGYDLAQLTGYGLSQLTGYDTSELGRAHAAADRDLAAAAALQLTLKSVAQNAAQLQGITPLSTVRWAVDLEALHAAASQVGGWAAQLQEAQAQATAERAGALARAQSLITEAQQVAASLSCAP
ncbi:hypothetical protein [Deinococcus soli (ex Cha et al. 2016)]|uniref:hypothetical protein n=1 Tax=Deinococcus soli (ex Cha et al. 2016) TaxID=1309411 RepID=UPI001666A693|nr:hypothetical protein [Deinococcus soli (ex Cha et al. 2016)]GGB70626.1 hypothetical protein GCM10008019_28490 [Deinococcus soli (ex Cha et al. 2016)]